MNKKILNFCLTLIVILIVIIFGAFYYKLTGTKATNSVYDDIQVSTQPSQDEVKEEFIGLDQSNIQKVYPFNGAFPGVDIMPFIFKDGDITEFSNEQILRLGFAKVTKDDWAPSYTGEGEPLSISASILDKYIKDIFGQNIEYKKENFSNTNYSIDKDFKAHTSSYEAKYDAKTDTYTINHIAGDGINENYVYLLEPNISKIKNNIEIEIPYVYIVYGDQPIEKEVNGEVASGFEYIVYANCDYETKTFSEELGRFSELDVNENGEFIMSEHVEETYKNDLSKIQKIRLIYENNEDGTELKLKEIK